jgi:hypothetical protein
MVRGNFLNKAETQIWLVLLRIYARLAPASLQSGISNLN